MRWVEKGDYFINVHGEKKTVGSVQLKQKSSKKEKMCLHNEELRAFPMTIDETFRDELLQSTFNIEKILEQLKINEEHRS